MSLDATRWAWQQQGLKASEKLVLLSLADRAGEDMTAFPSIDRMVKDTGLNRKTIIRCFDELEVKGVLLDTGERKGKTKRVKIYQLNGVSDRHDGNSTKNGTIKQSQKGDYYPRKQFQNYQETVPKTERLNSPKIGTQNLPVGNLSGNQKSKEKNSNKKTLDFSGWPSPPSEQVWADYKQHRREKKSPITQTVIDRLGKQLTILANQGITVDEALGTQLEAGWQGLKADWVLNRLGGQPHAQHKHTGQRKESLAERSWRESEEILADIERREAGERAVAADAPTIRPQVG